MFSLLHMKKLLFTAIAFSIFKTIIFSLVSWATGIHLLPDSVPLILISSIILFGYLAQFEFSWSGGRGYLSTFISSSLGSVLLLLNPAFQGTGNGIPPLPNWIPIPFIFLTLIISGCMGVWIFQFMAKKK